MVKQTALINRLLRIELFNLKHICPLVYKSNTHTGYIPFDKYSLEHDNTFLPFGHSKTVDLVTSATSVDLSRVYFVNGYNQHISLEKYIATKYHIK
jgi:hypothetical protein